MQAAQDGLPLGETEPLEQVVQAVWVGYEEYEPAAQAVQAVVP